MGPRINNRGFLALVAITVGLLAACSAQPSAPATSSYQGPEPGTVAVHMNGSVEATFGIR
jgi:hypothetical protein